VHLTRQADAVDAIIDAGRGHDCDVIVVGMNLRHSHSGLPSQVARRVLARAETTVLLTPLA
jgi:hypothetical protein